MAVDIVTYQGHDYIVVVEFYSKYPEIAMLERNMAAFVILHMKSMFARRGIPGQLVSDNNAVRTSIIQRLRKGMGDQVDDFEPDVSTVKQPKRTRRSDYEEHAEEGGRRVLCP